MKKNWPVFLCFAIGILCFILFTIIGSDVDEFGTLIEPFFLIPIGYLFCFMGLFGLLVKFVIKQMKSIQSHKNNSSMSEKHPMNSITREMRCSH